MPRGPEGEISLSAIRKIDRSSPIPYYHQLESVQRARQSPAFDSHSYSTFWDRPHYALTNLLADRIEAAQANRS